MTPDVEDPGGPKLKKQIAKRLTRELGFSVTRSNYFRVHDPEEFTNICRVWNIPENAISERSGKEFGSEEGELYLSFMIDHRLSSIEGFLKDCSKQLHMNDIVIIMESWYEPQVHSIRSRSFAKSKRSKVLTVDIDDIYTLARNRLGMQKEITLCEQ